MFGIEEIDAQQLQQWMSGEDKVRLVDVRTPAEIAQGMIPGSDYLPMHLVSVEPIEVADDEKLVIYCRSGARSGQVCGFLTQQRGLKNVFNLRGGIISWASAGYPVVAPEPDKVSGLG